MKKTLLAALLVAIAFPASAETSLPDVDPALWVVKDDDTTVYMFGTFHMLDGKQAWFNDGVKTAFDLSDELVLEAILPEDPAELQPLITKYAVDPDGRTLSSKLEPTVKTALEEQLGTLGVPFAAFDALEPWFVSMALTNLSARNLGLTGDYGPEKVLSAAANAAGMPISELEGVEFQLRLFDAMPEAQQVVALGQSVEEVARLDELFEPMLAAWSSGDPDALVSIMNESKAATPDLYETLFTERNATWAGRIHERLRSPGTVFLAVGAGHLAGKDSVQDFLAVRGIKSERVE